MPRTAISERLELIRVFARGLAATPAVGSTTIAIGPASGEIERVTSYEAGFVGHHAVRDGHTVPDPLILDERFVAASVRGRGVSVLSSCSHAGVVDAALGALGAFGGEPMDVVLGGYHLAGEGMEPPPPRRPSRAGWTIRGKRSGSSAQPRP